MKYQIGQELWLASFEQKQDSVPCTDCGGTARIRCIMHDNTIVSVECGACRRGYLGSNGKNTVWTRRPEVKRGTITGVDAQQGEVTRYYFRFSDCQNHIIDEDRLFDNKEAAETKAAALAEEYNAEEIARIAKKEKDTRSWAWNASYHRKQIKEAQKSIEYHTKKLNAASVKVKEP